MTTAAVDAAPPYFIEREGPGGELDRADAAIVQACSVGAAA